MIDGETIAGRPPPPSLGRWGNAQESRESFDVHLLPHSYRVFTVESK